MEDMLKKWAESLAEERYLEVYTKYKMTQKDAAKWLLDQGDKELREVFTTHPKFKYLFDFCKVMFGPAINERKFNGEIVTSVDQALLIALTVYYRAYLTAKWRAYTPIFNVPKVTCLLCSK
jgi:TusA-related sulfurtransferase